MNCFKKYKKLILGISFLMLGTFVHAQNDILEQTVSISFTEQTLAESFEELEEAAGINTAYNVTELADKKITLAFDEELLSEVLNALLENENLDYKLIGNTVTIFRKEKVESAVVAKGPVMKKAKKKTYTVSGYIMDADSKETLTGATAFVSNVNKGTSSNEYGFYSFTLTEGSYEFVFSYIGYESLVQTITLNQDVEFSPALSIGNQLQEVVIKGDAQSQRHAETQMSTNKITMADVKAIPALMGERDVLKVIQLMPGIQSGSEGTTGLYVRGGGPDQNLMLLDGVPVYNASHLFGFMSTFNGDAIKNVELIKGGFPARHGGRLSSIIDVRMKEGNMQQMHGDVTIGLISGRFNLEGPIVKDKTSFSFSGRRSWIDLLATPIQKLNNKGKPAYESKSVSAYNLYDINAKINHKFSNKSRLYLSSYLGNDKLSFTNRESMIEEDGKMDWGNRIATARWNYQFSPKLFSNTTLYFSAYDFNFNNELYEFKGTPNEIREIYSSRSTIQDIGAKLDFNYIPHPNHYIRAGLKYGMYHFTPTTTYQEFKEGAEVVLTSKNESPKLEGNEINAYVEDEMAITEGIRLNLGVHAANFAVENSNYLSIQPRASMSILLGSKSSLKFSATKMTQYLHLLASPGLGLPTDLWVSSTDQIKPENSWQYGVGYTRTVKDGYELTIEGFYKKMDNLLAYRSGFNFFSNSKDWENKVDIGDGKSFGGEILLEKTKGKTTGWIGYTLSKSTRTFPEINFGETFPYKYDRRHDIGLAIIHKRSSRMDFGLIWVYGTGNTYTLGTTNYNALGIDSSIGGEVDPFETLGTTGYIESRNNQRMPAYHRLDISVNLHKVKKRGTRTWSFGVYNVYARQNPYVVYRGSNDSGQDVLKQQSLLPILPYFSYSFKF